ncbi:MAG: DUF835 domain-containing protein [Thermoplasmata archaeon]
MFRGSLKKPSVGGLILFVLLLPLLNSQGAMAEEGAITVSADFEVLQYAEGGGHITWRLEGDAATEYRHALLVHLYGENATTASISARDLFNRYFVGYGSVENCLEGVQGYKKIRVWGVEIRRSEPLSKGDYGSGEAALEVDTTGLLGTTWNSQESIEIKYLLGCRMYEETEKSNPVLAHFALVKVLYAPFYYAINNTTKLEDIHVGIDVVNQSGNWSLAPSASDKYPVTFHTVAYTVGALSCSEFSGVNPLVIRTPAGYIIKLDATYDTWQPASFTFSTLDPIESPAILFVVLVIFIVLLRYFPNTFFMRYRQKLPRELRANVKKIRWWHYTVLLLCILYILVYFFAAVYFGGIAMIVMGVLLVVPDALASYYLYKKKFEKIKVMPIKREAPPMPMPQPPVVAGIDKTIQCSQCGTSFTIKYAGAPMEVECPKCHARGVFKGEEKKTMKIEHGMNNLLITSDIAGFYKQINEISKQHPVLCLSTQYPDKLKQVYGLENAKFEWISSMSTKEGTKPLDPKRLEFEIMLTISSFMRNNQKAVVVIDGLEMLIVENGFDKVLKFVKKVVDIANTTQSMIYVPLSPGTLTPDQEAMLSKAFDKVWKD